MTPELRAHFPSIPKEATSADIDQIRELARRCEHSWVRHADGGAVCTDCTMRMWANDLRAEKVDGDALAASSEAQRTLCNAAKRLAYA